MCHWLGKCLAFSVYYRKVWRSSICSDLSTVSCSVGIANHGNGIPVGRGSQASIALSFDRLEPLGTKWHWYKWFGIGGNYLLMMFYTTIVGWLLLYTGKMAIGEFKGLDADGVTGVFTSLLGQPVTMTICMILVVVLCFGIVCMGLQKGVEQITKKMMILLFA